MQNTDEVVITKKVRKLPPVKRKTKRFHYDTNKILLLVMALMGVVFIIMFSYVPMFGIILAFKDGDLQFNILDAIFKSDFVGLRHFKSFLTDIRFKDIMLNTLGFNILNLLISMPAPVIMALIVNEIRHPKTKKFFQMLSFLPHFVSGVVYVGIIHSMLDMQTGIVNDLLKTLGIIDKSINFKGDPKYSWMIMICSGILKGAGWGSIIYLAAITGVDMELYDAAQIDGVNRFQKMWYITLPTLAPIFSLQLILNLSNILENDASSMLLWQTMSNLDRTEVLSTFILKEGINNAYYSYATAASLCLSLVGLLMMLSGNWVSKKLTGEGIIF